MPRESPFVQTARILLVSGLLLCPGAALAADEVRPCSAANPAATIAACTQALSEKGASEAQLVLALIERGAAHQELGDYAKASTDFSSAIEIAPDSAFAYLRRGYCHLLLSSFDAAIADFTQALTHAPDLRDVYANRASEIGRAHV